MGHRPRDQHRHQLLVRAPGLATGKLLGGPVVACWRSHLHGRTREPGLRTLSSGARGETRPCASVALRMKTRALTLLLAVAALCAPSFAAPRAECSAIKSAILKR